MQISGQAVALGVLLPAIAVFTGLTTIVARRRAEPGLTAFTAFTGSTALATGVTTLLVLGDLAGIIDADRYRTVVYVLVYLTAIPWFVFVLEFTGRGELLSRRWITLLGSIGPTFLVYVLINNLSDIGGLAAVINVIIGVLLLFVVFLLLFGGIALFIWTTFVYDHLSTGMGLLVSAGVTVLLVVVFVTETVGQTEFGSARFAVFGIGMLCSAIMLWLGVSRFDTFDSTAAAAGAIGRETVFTDLEDAVIVLDNHQHIVECNPSARETFGLSRRSPLGKPFESVFGVTADELLSTDTIALETVEGTRQFDVQRSELTDQHGTHLGVAISCRDVTERELREQRISILNRVLRHNLRNKLAIVRGNAEIILDSDTQLDRFADDIQCAADDLLELGERARDIEQLLTAQRETHSPTPVTPAVEAALTDISGSYPDVSFTLTTEEPLQVSANEAVLRHVLEQLVDNAAKHNDSPQPEVSVHCRSDGDRIRLSVADNGPGVPEQERTAILQGEESPLEHASGLGLWGVHWGVTAIGGDLAFEPNEPRGTIVHVVLPRAWQPTERGGSVSATR
jgi:PAS domain S-box-containing protein